MKESLLRELGLSNREVEKVRMDTYYRGEYSKEYKDEWYYGNDKVDELCICGQDINGKYKNFSKYKYNEYCDYEIWCC